MTAPVWSLAREAANIGFDPRTVTYGGQIKSGWTTALKGSGIGRPLSPHHCRHTWATHWYCVTPDPFRLREAGGWASISQVERYAKLAPAGMRDDIMAFWGLAALQSAAPHHLGMIARTMGEA